MTIDFLNYGLWLVIVLIIHSFDLEVLLFFIFPNNNLVNLPILNASQLNKLVEKYNTLSFIENDPICIPHKFSKKQDIEITGFLAAIFAWGQRTTIINKANDFIKRMDRSPHDFILNFKPHDLITFQSFKHRTFNGDDAISLLYFFQHIYQEHQSMEFFFQNKNKQVVFQGLQDLDQAFRSLTSTMKRSQKHISSPARSSACKRLNMFLRWMVRSDRAGVDFGIWNAVSPSDLIIPLDVHVLRAANVLGLIDTEKANWKTAVALTEKLAKLDPEDPVKYDFALFNYSLTELGRNNK